MALAEIERDGFGDRLPDLVERARHAVAPLPYQVLADRLSTMQLAMTQGWSDAKATAWLGETARLLADVPGDVLLESLDEAIRQSARGFMPSVGEIMAIAQPAIERRSTTLARLEAVERLKGGGGALPAPRDFDPATRCTPEDAAAIKAELGIYTPTRMAKPAPATEQEYIRHGLSPAEAAQAVRDHERMMSGAAMLVGSLAPRAPGRSLDDYFREHCVDPDNPTEAEQARVSEAILSVGRRKWTAEPVEPRLTDAEQREVEDEMRTYDRRLRA